MGYSVQKSSALTSLPLNLRAASNSFFIVTRRIEYSESLHTFVNVSLLSPVNLVVDELYQVAHTEQFMRSKLSQYAKFGLKPIISAHYLNQIRHIRDELRSVNASYMLISGCDKKNYEELKSELYPYTEEDLLRLPRFHSLNLVKNKDGYGRFITKPPPVN